jgi:hypothetical protein
MNGTHTVTAIVTLLLVATVLVPATFRQTEREHAEELPTASTWGYPVEAFGAVKDCTTDDSASIQAAIDEATSAGGGVVAFSAGCYSLGKHDRGKPETDHALIVRAPVNYDGVFGGIQLVGAGKDVTFLDFRGTGQAIEFGDWDGDPSFSATAQVSGIEIRDLSIRQRGARRSGIAIAGEVFTQFRLENLSIGTPRADYYKASPASQGFAQGVVLYGVSDFGIIENLFMPGNAVGVSLTGQGNGVSIRSVDIAGDPDASSPQVGIVIKDSVNVSIANSRFHDFSAGKSVAVRAEGQTWALTVMDNYFEDCRRGVWIYSDRINFAPRIVNNYFNSDRAGPNSVSVELGVPGGLWGVKSPVVSGNVFAHLPRDGTAVAVNNDVDGYLLESNVYLGSCVVGDKNGDYCTTDEDCPGSANCIHKSQQPKRIGANRKRGLDRDYHPATDASREVDSPSATAECMGASSASTVQIDGCSIVSFAGNETIRQIETCDDSNRGQEVRILCSRGQAPRFADGKGNLQLAGDFACTRNDTLLIACDGANWLEGSRSVN